MANDFSGDANCVALWKFDDGALTTDSIGGNTLISHGAPAADTGDYQEGDASVDLDSATPDYFDRADADLDADFPFKSGGGESSRIISICGWYKCDAFPAGSTGYHILCMKHATDKAGFQVAIYSDSGTFRIRKGDPGGSSYENADFTTNCATGVWYHFGVTYSDVTDAYRIRIWDDNAGALLDSDVTGSFSNDGNSEDGPWWVSDDSTNVAWDGHIDELVVFKDVLTTGEIDYIRGGLFGTGTTTTTSSTTSTTSSTSSTASTTSSTSSTASTTSSTSSTASTSSTSSTASTTSSTSSTASTSSTSSTSSTASTTSSTSSTASTTSSTTSSTSSSTSSTSSTASTASTSSSTTTSTTTTYGGDLWVRCSTAVRDLTSQITLLTYQNTTDEIQVCQGVVHLGDGVNDLDGSGGDFELTLQFGSQVNQPDPQLIYFSSATRASVFTIQFPLPINETVHFRLRSPNAADTSVWTHACIYEVTDLSSPDYATPVPGGTIFSVYDDPGGVYSDG